MLTDAGQYEEALDATEKLLGIHEKLLGPVSAIISRFLVQAGRLCCYLVGIRTFRISSGKAMEPHSRSLLARPVGSQYPITGPPIIIGPPRFSYIPML